MIDYDHRKSTDNWAEVDYDRSVWYPIPLGFKGTKWVGPAEWAYDYALDRFLRGERVLTRKVVKREVLPFAERLLVSRQAIAGHVPGHRLYGHCPDYTKSPVPASVGLWKTMGDWQQAVEYYAYWGTKTATTQPVAERFETNTLGTGVKTQWIGANPEPYHQVNYVFRDETYETDIHILLIAQDHDRFTEAVPDLDNLVRSIRCVPDPGT